MDAEMTSEQAMLRDTVRAYLTDACSVDALDRIDDDAVFPADVYRGLAEIGVVGLLVPQKYGGGNGSHLDVVLVCEEMGRTSGSVTMAYFTTSIFGVGSVTAFGTEEQKAEILPAVAQGDMLLAFALTEPDAGSDAGSLRTRAEKVPGGWLVNGTKIFCTGADVARYLITAVRTDGGDGTKGISTLLIPADAPGIMIQPIPLMGHFAVHSCEVVFEDVYVDETALMGERAAGWRNVLQILDLERLGTAGVCVGIAAAVTDLATAHARSRQQFGRPIGEFQAVGHMVAEMAIHTEAARRLTYWAAREIDRGAKAAAPAAMAKAYATTTATAVATDGVQVFGGYGYTKEYPIQRYYREAKLYEVAGGTTQIQRGIVARALGL